MIRKTISLFLIATFAFALFGCSKDASEKTRKRKSKETAVTTTVSEVFGGIEDEPCSIALFEIESKDLENGYYCVRVPYEEGPDITYEMTFDLYFERFLNFDHDWEVYILNYKISGTDYSYLEYQEPTLYNDAGVTVVSGQWIYVHCDDFESFDGGYSAVYSEYPIQRRELTQDDEFYEFMSSVSFYYAPPPNGDGYMLFDVTGDGVEDRCTTVMVGSGIVHDIFVVYDPVEHRGYTLGEYNYDYRIEGIEDNRLIVTEIQPQTGSKPEKKFTGTVVLENEMLVFVPDEIN